MIISITGTLGAGKGTIVEYLGCKGYRHFSARDLLVAELDNRGLEHNRENMLLTANDLRATYGPSYIAEQLLAMAKEDSSNAVIESIRSIGEARFLKEHGARLWAVDADPQLRYNRVQGRASVTDRVSFDEFRQHEAAEFANTDPAKNNLRGVMMMADDTFTNNGTPMELFKQVEHALMRCEEGTDSAYTPPGSDAMSDEGTVDGSSA